MDPEIESMAKISAALLLLEDEAARARVLKWASERFGLTPATTLSRGAQVFNQTPPTNPVKAGGSEFHDFIDSFEMKSGLDRILVVGYWFQAIQGEETIGSYQINGELKNLGYPSTNISRDMVTLTARRLVLQVRKEGSSQQARKRFRLTRKGLDHVEAFRKNHLDGGG